MKEIKSVLVGMSGGVDSSVAALLLKRQGYNVGGATMRLWDGMKEKDLQDAKAVCEKLQIPHYVFDLRDEFRDKVIGDFAHKYELGVTPNPCVVCNREIKFGAFIRKAHELGFSHVSTGHFAHISYDDATKRYRVKLAASLEKDQSYVFYSLTQEQLGKIILPLGGYSKPEVRDIARDNDLIVSRKSESQDICFIPDGDYVSFLTDYLKKDGEAGNFIGIDGKVLGRHKGVWHYTIGQRKGLGLSFEQPMYVSGINADSNTVTLSPNAALFKRELTATSVNWIDYDAPPSKLRILAKIRYGAKPAAATVTTRENKTADIVFDEPQRAITPGQSVAFYDGDYLIGGGVIAASYGS